MGILRGDMYFIDVPQEYRAEHEECFAHMHVVISRNELNGHGRTVIVAPMTSLASSFTGLESKQTGIYRESRIRIPSNQKIWDSDAPHKQDGDSLVKTEQMFCLSQSYLKDLKRCGKLTDIAINSLESGLCYVLNIPIIGRKQAKAINPGGPIRPPMLT